MIYYLQNRVNIQKKGDSNISVLMRIMTNYLQIIAATLSYNLQFPTYFLDIFSSVQTAGNSSGIFLSYDCLLMETRANDAFDNIAYLKVMCLAFIPMVIICCSALLYCCIFYKDKVKIKRYICVTVITVIFLFHATITQFALRIFK